MPLKIVRNDIVKVKADIIVNTANPRPVVGGGTDKAVYDAAGREELLRYRKEIGDIEPGHIAVTPALALNARYIIHTVGPVWEGGSILNLRYSPTATVIPLSEQMSLRQRA